MPKFNTPFTLPSSSTTSGFNTKDLNDFMKEQRNLSELWPDEDCSLQDNIDKVFAFHEEGFFVYQPFDTMTIMKRLQEGRIFALDHQNQLHQIRMDRGENNRLQMSVSEPMKIVEPKAPSFFTYLFAWLIPSWREEINAYNQQVRFNAELKEYVKDNDFTVDFNPGEPKAEKEQPQQEVQQEIQQEVQKQVQNEEPEFPTKDEDILKIRVNPKGKMLTPQQFEKYLNAVDNFGIRRDLALLSKGGGTAEEYLDIQEIHFQQLMNRGLNKQIRANPGDKYRILEKAQPGFWAMRAGLRDFISSKVDMDKLNEILETGLKGSPHLNYFLKLSDYMDDTYGKGSALADFAKHGQLAQQQAQKQAQQPEREQQAPAMSGPSICSPKHNPSPVGSSQRGSFHPLPPPKNAPKRRKSTRFRKCFFWQGH